MLYWGPWMQPYLEIHFLGALLVRSSVSMTAWELMEQHFQPPFFVTSLQALRIEHMLLHPLGTDLKTAALRGYQEWQRNLHEGVFQLASIEWEAAYRLAMDLNRRGVDASVSPLHYLEASSAAILDATHFVCLEAGARAAASMLGLKLVPEKMPGKK